MRHCSGSSVKRGGPIRSPYRMWSSAANTQGKSKHSYRLRHPASHRRIIARPRRLETLEVLYGLGYPSDLDSGGKEVTRWEGVSQEATVGPWGSAYPFLWSHSELPAG